MSPSVKGECGLLIDFHGANHKGKISRFPSSKARGKKFNVLLRPGEGCRGVIFSFVLRRVEKKESGPGSGVDEKRPRRGGSDLALPFFTEA